MKVRLQPGKTEYTEAEAARALGVSPNEFRSLMLRHLVNEKEAMSNVALMRFRPSDLLLLGMFDQSMEKEGAAASHSDSCS